MLTNKQNQLLNFLILRIEQNGISPSYEEICLELNLKSKSGIHRIVKALEERGAVEKSVTVKMHKAVSSRWYDDILGERVHVADDGYTMELDAYVLDPKEPS